MQVAFVDESKRSSGGAGLYVLTAFVAIDDEELTSSYRSALRSLLPVGQQKLHWYKSVEHRRSEIINLVAKLEVVFVVVARNMSHGEGDERARKKCLELLVVELESLGVEEAILESRQSTLDHRDRSYLDRLRSMRAPGSSIRISHFDGREEPLLWVADVVAGAFGDSAVYNERRWRELIEPKLFTIYAEH